jgi:hypothetical protein
MDVMHLAIIVVAGIILADLISNPTGTTAVLSGIQTMWQIMTNPTNTKGL